MSNIKCPNCGEDHWKTAPVVYQEGLSTITSSSVGVGMGGGSLGVGTAVSKGVQQTNASKLAAPPVKKRNENADISSPTFFFTGVILLFAAFKMTFIPVLAFIELVVGIGCLVGWIKTAPAAKLALEKEEQKYQAALKRWENTKICQRCGTKF